MNKNRIFPDTAIKIKMNNSHLQHCSHLQAFGIMTSSFLHDVMQVTCILQFYRHAYPSPQFDSIDITGDKKNTYIYQTAKYWSDHRQKDA